MTLSGEVGAFGVLAFLGRGEENLCHWGRFRSACLLICLMVWCSNIGSAE